MRQETLQIILGDGTLAWQISEFEIVNRKAPDIIIKNEDGTETIQIGAFTSQEEMTSKYLVYNDPNILPTPKVNVIGLLQSLSTDELNAVKQILIN